MLPYEAERAKFRLRYAKPAPAPLSQAPPRNGNLSPLFLLYIAPDAPEKMSDPAAKTFGAIIIAASFCLSASAIVS